MTAVSPSFPARRPSRWTAFRRRSPTSLKIGAVILLLHSCIATIGPLVVPYGYGQMGAGAPLSGVSWAHPFGIDQLGRDVLSRVVYGAHIVILLSLSGTILAVFVGSVIGLFCGYVRGWIDNVMQRLLETLMSIPFLVLALLVISAAGPDLAGNPALVVLVIALVYAPRVARMARAVALDVATRDFVTVARLRGDSTWSVMWRELLPNASGVLLVEFALRASYAPVLLGSLGFLGFGLRPPTPEWGLMMSENRQFITISPMTVLGPGLTLASLVVGLNLFTEGLARVLGGAAPLGR